MPTTVTRVILEDGWQPEGPSGRWVLGLQRVVPGDAEAGNPDMDN